jgi:hypothetical protein
MKPLVTVVVELKALLADPERNFTAIVTLLDQHANRAEYEVARFLATRALMPLTEAKLKHRDPEERKAAVQAVGLAFARAPATRILRRAVKDPVPTVAAEARRFIKALQLDDVAPPDTRYRPRAHSKKVWNRGGWNPSGWLFGLRPGHRHFKAPPGLPPLRTRDDVARLLELPPGDLGRFMRAGAGPGSGYVEFERPKRTGGVRVIAAPREPLRSAQRRLLDQVLSKVEVHAAAQGFVRGRSILTNAQPHTGAALVAKVDLEDFFPTIHYRRVRGLFLSLGYNETVASALAGLTTWRPTLEDGTVAWPGVLPQGAPTSPAIANLVCRRLDRRLTALALRYGATYSRYADDLTFSFRTVPQNVGRVLWWVNSICQQEGFFEHTRKRRLMRQSGRMAVTNLTVNQRVSISREDRRRFKAILANCRKHGMASQARGKERFRDWLHGYAAFVAMVNPELGKKWLAQVATLKD